MERADRAGVAGVFCAAAASACAGGLLALDEDAAQHVRVRRLRVGEPVRVHDGAGTVARGALHAVERRAAVVHVERVERVPPPAAVHLLVPVADRERMLWLAEKGVELGLASWRPVAWRRSRSVAGRGEGEGFAAKVRARMAAAMVQSGAAWLPELHAERPLATALAALPPGERLVLDRDGAPLPRLGATAPLVLALGPEGGFDPDEVAALGDAGFRPVSLGPNVLRFETAGIAALAVVASLLSAVEAAPHA